MISKGKIKKDTKDSPSTSSSTTKEPDFPNDVNTHQHHTQTDSHVFLQYLDNEDMSDIQIVLENEETPIFAHKFILAAKSAYFKKLLFGSFFEKGAGQVKIQGVTRKIMLLVLEFIYSGSVRTLKVEDIIFLSKAANMFLLVSLQDLCVAFLEEKLTSIDCTHLFLQSVEHNVIHVMNLILQTHSDVVLNSDFILKKLSVDVMKNVLSSDAISLEERQIFESVLKWAKLHSNIDSSSSFPDAKELPQEVIDTAKPLLQYIRWSDIDAKYIAANVEPLNLIDQKLLLAVYRFQLTGIKQDEMITGSINPFRSRESGGGKPFTHTSDFDANGIMYYLGTLRDSDLNNPSAYQNPHTSKVVEVTSSSVKYGCKVEDFITREKVNNMTKNEPGSWFCIDLKKFSCKPTHYTLRYGGSGGDSCPRNWDFEASNNGSNWTLLSSHKNDKSIDKGWASFTFPLNPTPRQFFRYFRVRMTGKNKNNTDFLLNSGFELYGFLRHSNP